MSSEIWVCGEVLIDLIAHDGEKLAVVGGGPANTAKALARLGLDSHFIDGISSGAYGQKARAELLADGVKLDYALTSDKPMCTADVTLDQNGSASYIFTIDGTATFDFSHSWLPEPSTVKPAVLHIGTLVILVEPGAAILHEWASKVADFAPIVFDPNVRPSVVGDRDLYQAAVAKWSAISSVIKVSEDDIAWLYPDRKEIDVAREWISDGVALVVITQGAHGLIGVTSEGKVQVPGVTVEVVDTVGAGDTVGAIVVEGLLEYGLTNLRGEVLEKVLHRAAAAAAITCSRAGAKPPTRAEIEA
ncbi:MAG: carbohydrate kinase [Actinomycetes bacterium]